MSETVAQPPALRDFAKYARPRPARYLTYSLWLEAVYWPLLALFVYTTFHAYVDGGLIALASSGFFILLGLVELTGRLRRRFRVDAAKALARASGAPVLYLRSFYYESADHRPPPATSLDQRKEARRERENDDEVLALALRGLGPLVAVGKPGTKIPPLGAIRLFFKDDEWQAHVKRLIAAARLVIVQPGYSDGTEWEMRTLRDMGLPPEKIIFSFLSWQHLSRASRQVEYEMFAIQLKRMYGLDLPPKLGGAYFLYFDRDWRPRLAGVPLWQRPFFWLCSRPSVVWTLISRLNVDSPYWLFKAMFLTITYLFDYLPTPRLFRRFSVPGVREALRPALGRSGLRLPVWRTVCFATAAALLVAVMWVAPSLYEGVPGHYRIAAYDRDEALIFSGDLRVNSTLFDGTYELKFEHGAGSPPDCYVKPPSGGESVSGTLRGEGDGEHSRLKLTFEGLGQTELVKSGRFYEGFWFSLRPEPRRVDVNSLKGEEKWRALGAELSEYYGVKDAREELRLAVLCGGKRMEVEKLLW